MQGMLRKASDGVSIAKAAELMGVTGQTIRHWITAGHLPATRFGPKIIRIDPKDLEALRKQL